MRKVVGKILDGLVAIVSFIAAIHWGMNAPWTQLWPWGGLTIFDNVYLSACVGMMTNALWFSRNVFDE